MFERSIDQADPLSEILALADVQTVVTGEFRASGPWGLAFPPPQGLKFLAVVHGSAWLRMEGSDDRPLAAGDLLLMNHRLPYVLASAQDAAAQDGQALMRALPAAHRVLVMGAGDETVLMGGHVSLDRDCGLPLADLLPKILQIQGQQPGAGALRWLLAQLMQERAARTLGHQAVTSHLAHLLFLQILRLHFADAELASSWLRVLADPRLLPAVQRMHAEPGRHWQLDELASASAMSRTSFAVKFRTVAGVPPMAYLTQWRILLAQRNLRRDNRPLAAWIGELGYASESAFSHAFKRLVGVTPGQYRERARLGSSAAGAA